MKIYLSRIKGNKNNKTDNKRQSCTIIPLKLQEVFIYFKTTQELPIRKTLSTATGLCQYWQSSSIFHWYSLLQTPCVLYCNRDTSLISGETCMQVKLQRPAFWNFVYSSHYLQVNHLKEKVKPAFKWLSSESASIKRKCIPSHATPSHSSLELD